MKSGPGQNRRRGPRAEGTIEAPADPMPGHRADEPSPAPPATTQSVRPPPRPLGRGRGLLPAMQLALGIAVVLAASTGVAWGARRYLRGSPRFGVRTVLVEGSGRLDAAQIAALGGIAVGANIFAIDLEDAEARIEASPWVERAKVVRKLPSTVAIDVVLREARVLAAIGGELYLASADGEPFKRFEGDDPVDMPVVTGIGAEQASRDRRGVVLAIRRALDALEELDRAGISKRWPVQELHVERDGPLVATVGKEAMALHLGLPPYRSKVDRAQRVLAELSRRKGSASTVFVDNESHPERVVVRMR